MPFRKRRFSRRGSQMPRGRKVWGGFTTVDVDGKSSPVALDPGEFTSTWLINPVDAQEFYDEPTLMRILGDFSAIADSPNDSSASFSVHGFFTLVLASEDDLAGPVFKNPFDTTQQWIFWKEFYLWRRSLGLFAFGSIAPETGQTGWGFDLRTRRKIPEGYGIAAQVWNDDDVGADFVAAACPLTFFSAGRVLFNDH